MRYLSMFLVIVVVFMFALTFASIAAADPLTPRPVDPVAADTFAAATAKSATVRSLVATLEQSDVIVHIESSKSLPYGIGGFTRFVASAGGYRYVRITISAELPPRQRSAILAHELQHACEVAASRAADTDSLRELFAHSGHRTGDFYET